MIEYEATRRWIHMFAYKVQRRCHAAGAPSVQIEDIVSECNVAWVIARDNFDPERGVPFLAFLKRGTMFHINRWVAAEIKEGVALSFDKPSDEMEGTSLYDLIPDDDADTPDVRIMRNDRRRIIDNHLNEGARQVVDLLANPPQELLDEVKAMQARIAVGKAKGLKVNRVRDLTMGMVFDLLGYGEVERKAFTRDFRRARANADNFEV